LNAKIWLGFSACGWASEASKYGESMLLTEDWTYRRLCILLSINSMCFAQCEGKKRQELDAKPEETCQMHVQLALMQRWVKLTVLFHNGIGIVLF